MLRSLISRIVEFGLTSLFFIFITGAMDSGPEFLEFRGFIGFGIEKFNASD